MSLRDMVLELIKELHHACEAAEHFDTKIVRMALDELIELITEASTEISVCYSRPTIGESLSRPTIKIVI